MDPPCERSCVDPEPRNPAAIASILAPGAQCCREASGSAYVGGGNPLRVERLEPADALLFASIDDADIDSGLAAGLAAFSAAIGVAQLIAGVLILRLQDRGRILALVVSGIGIIGAAISLAQGVPSAVLGLILNVMVIVFLQQHRDAFHR